MYEDSMSNAVRIYNENRFAPNKSISEAAYLIRYLRYEGEPEDTIAETVKKLFYNIYGVPSRPDMSVYYNKSVKFADKLPPLQPLSVAFTKNELDYIQSLNNIYGEVFVFCALVAYKYKVTTNQDAKFDVLWNDAFSPTINGLRTFCSIGRNVYEKIYDFVRNTDCIETTIFKNKDIIKFDDNLLSLDCGEIALEVDNFTNIAYYYLEYIGKIGCFRCQNCGTILQRRRGGVKYCKVCARRANIIKTNASRHMIES